MTSRAGRGAGSTLDHEPAVEALERAVEGLRVAIRVRHGRDPGDPALVELRHLRDELASHVLAARVLVSSGASPSALAPVLERARGLVESSRHP